MEKIAVTQLDPGHNQGTVNYRGFVMRKVCKITLRVPGPGVATTVQNSKVDAVQIGGRWHVVRSDSFKPDAPRQVLLSGDVKLPKGLKM